MNLFQSIFPGGESRGRYPESFDHLLALALNRIAEVRVEREDLIRQRDLLRRKRSAQPWSVGAGPSMQDRACLRMSAPSRPS